MQRIILHHSAGGYVPSAIDKQHYHRIIDGDGKAHAGKFPISANAPGASMRSGTYAAHTRNCNTGSIGVSMACMAGALWSDPRACPAFPKPAQVDGLIAEVARLCREYSIPVLPTTVLSHAEVQRTLGITQLGKWDFDYDPRGVNPSRDPVVIGNGIRQEVLVALGYESPSAPRGPMPVIRRGSAGEAVMRAQRLLGLTADGMFGPRTEAAAIAFQKRNQLLPDGIIGRATWAALTKEKSA